LQKNFCFLFLQDYQLSLISSIQILENFFLYNFFLYLLKLNKDKQDKDSSAGNLKHSLIKLLFFIYTLI
jgi:hypothetical protein